MRTLLEPFLLRRLKSQVATQLVAKSQQVLAVSSSGCATVTMLRLLGVLCATNNVPVAKLGVRRRLFPV